MGWTGPPDRISCLDSSASRLVVSGQPGNPKSQEVKRRTPPCHQPANLSGKDKQAETNLDPSLPHGLLSPPSSPPPPLAPKPPSRLLSLSSPHSLAPATPLRCLVPHLPHHPITLSLSSALTSHPPPHDKRARIYSCRLESPARRPAKPPTKQQTKQTKLARRRLLLPLLPLPPSIPPPRHRRGKNERRSPRPAPAEPIPNRHRLDIAPSDCELHKNLLRHPRLPLALPNPHPSPLPAAERARHPPPCRAQSTLLPSPSPSSAREPC